MPSSGLCLCLNHFDWWLPGHLVFATIGIFCAMFLIPFRLVAPWAILSLLQLAFCAMFLIPFSISCLYLCVCVQFLCLVAPWAIFGFLHWALSVALWAVLFDVFHNHVPNSFLCEFRQLTLDFLSFEYTQAVTS